MDDREDPSRRDFLKNCVVGGVALGAADGLAMQGALAQPAAKSTVALAIDPQLRGGGAVVDPLRIAALLDRAMAGFCGDADGGWKQIVELGQVVGLKVNCLGGPGIATNVSLVNAIVAKLRGAGIRANDIVVWDRFNGELEKVGFHVNTAPGPDDIRCFGTETVGYEETRESYGVVNCALSKILTRVCDVVINVPVLKDHSMAGVTLAMKNMYGVIDNPRDCHDGGCNPAVADINMLPTIRKKVRFVVADASTALYEGGPGFKPQYTWHHNAVMVARDAVAIDTIGWQIIERKRAEMGLPTLEAAGRPPRYIATAADADHRLGNNDPRAIAIVEA
jgi:uncharacterized protein (DUF362 family)